jgi:hypothetical protein
MSGPAARHEVTRRQLLQGAATAAGLAVVGDRLLDLPHAARTPRRIGSFVVSPTGSVRGFHSRPDLRPPTVTTTFTGGLPALERPDTDDPSGYVFLGPGPVSLSGSQQYGPLIIDRRGEPVWFRPLPPGVEVTNFTTAIYRGEPVLMWWQGTIEGSGYGHGEAVIVDRAYREVARVRAAGGRSMDLHALWLSPAGTALFSCYPDVVQADLSAVGGPPRAPVYEAIIQEVDVASGRLLSEWRSLSHIPVGDSYMPVQNPAVNQGPSMQWPYDYLHVNSIGPTPDGGLLVSGRHAWSLYKLDWRTGTVRWKLGGKRSDFRMGEGAQFAWQHDPRQISAGGFTVFDNGSNGYTNTESQSRGLVLDVDETRRTVSLRRAYTSPKQLATSMGSVQLLPSGRVIVGWGTASHTTEFDSDGTELFDIGLPSGLYSYRGVWSPWAGSPHRRPAVAAGSDQNTGAKLVYASWNGSTEVAGWRVDAGLRGDELSPVGIARRLGFETVVPLHRDFRFAAVTALDRVGMALARSDTIRL